MSIPWAKIAERAVPSGPVTTDEFGGIGLFAEGLMWLLVIGLVLLVVSAFAGYSARGRARV